MDWSTIGRLLRSAWIFASLVAVTLNMTRAGAAEILTNNPNGKSGTCDLVLMGSIEASDDLKFRSQLVDLLKSGCSSPRIHLYSQGGNLKTAIMIARQVHFLQAATVGPELLGAERIDDRDAQSRNGPRVCQFLPGSRERASREIDAIAAFGHAFRRAIEAKTALPKAPKRQGDYDPTSGRGDPRCSCASACFFIWAAGVERRGDAIEIHRPYFDPDGFSRLSLSDAREAYRELMDESRSFLGSVGVSPQLVERMFGIDSQSASYLTTEELRLLRTAPHFSELKLAKCGQEPRLEEESAEPDNYKGGRYAGLTPQQRRWFIKRAKREICWLEAQKKLRGPAIEEYLRLHPR